MHVRVSPQPLPAAPLPSTASLALPCRGLWETPGPFPLIPQCLPAGVARMPPPEPWGLPMPTPPPLQQRRRKFPPTTGSVVLPGILGQLEQEGTPDPPGFTLPSCCLFPPVFKLSPGLSLLATAPNTNFSFFFFSPILFGRTKKLREGENNGERKIPAALFHRS